MTDTTAPNFRPRSEPRPVLFRVDLRWQGPPLDAHRLHVAQGFLDLFTGTFRRPDDPGPPPPRVMAINEDFAATFAIDAAPLGQLLQCLGILRAFRFRFTPFEAGESIDDVTERLEAVESWSYYPDPERAAKAQDAAVEAATAKKKARPRFTGGG